MATRRFAVLVLAMMLFALAPTVVNAEDSGGVQASSATVGISPTNPVEGGEVSIRLTLFNQNNFQANDVIYKFYWNGIHSSKLIEANTVDIPAESSVNVDVLKSGLTAGEHQVWIAFDYASSGEQIIIFDIDVAGLPDLEVMNFETSPSEVNSGDEVTVSVEIGNTGSENASSSQVKIDLGDQEQVVQIDAIDAGNTTWANVTMIAPDSGDHTISATVDLNDDIIEADDEHNVFTHVLTVSPRMDIYHEGDLSVAVDSNSLQGPWIISGTIARTGGDGVTMVPMKLEIIDDSGQTLPLPTFNVNISGGENAQQAWNFQLNYSQISTLSSGNHLVTAVIDPYQSAAFVQESEDNDRANVYIEKYEVPDVSVDPIAIPEKSRIVNGESVVWKVNIINSGQIDVRGRIVYTWEGTQYDDGISSEVTIAPGELYQWEKSLIPDDGEHTANLIAQWVSSQGYYDENPTNSYAEGSVDVIAQLRLVWSKASMKLVDADGNNASSPLQADERYTISITSNAQELGSVNYSCEDQLGGQFELIPVTVDETGIFITIDCTFTATAPYTNVYIIADDKDVSDPISWNFDTKENSDNVAADAGDMSFQTVGLIALIIGVLIAVLVAAIILTREREEEVERDIFDYCPACDGELDGTEDRCPSCSFNLKKARRQFHDCESCGESIPDLLGNCPYCGTAQDVSKYFEKRERKLVERETISLPEEEEEIDPETIHATGYEDFDEAIKEFGYESDDLEKDWEGSIAEAEAEVEAAYDRRVAQEELEELDDDEAMSTYTTTLKSIEETFESHDIDAILKDKDIQTHDVEDVDDLSASDAEIRAKLYEITGEEGVMPGDEVKIGMGIQDRSLAGNELPDDAMDFSFEDDDELDPVKSATESNARRRNLRRRSKEKVETAECGACGTDIPIDAKECSTCGAKFE